MFQMWAPKDGRDFVDSSTMNLPGPYSQIDTFSDELSPEHENSMKQAILHPGEILITGNYWHQAFNLEPSVAVSSNFHSSLNVRDAIRHAIEIFDDEYVSKVNSQSHFFFALPYFPT